MAISSRVRDDAEGTVVTATPLGCKRPEEFLIARSGKGFRVYESVADYSSTTGGFNRKGAVQRDADGRPKNFASESEAEQWLADGLPVT